MNSQARRSPAHQERRALPADLLPEAQLRRRRSIHGSRTSICHGPDDLRAQGAARARRLAPSQATEIFRARFSSDDQDAGPWCEAHAGPGIEGATRRGSLPAGDHECGGRIVSTSICNKFKIILLPLKGKICHHRQDCRTAARQKNLHQVCQDPIKFHNPSLCEAAP